MKQKTSITLSSDVLRQVDRRSGSRHSRSAFIEQVLRKYLRERERAELHARELKRLNDAAEWLNREAEDVLQYQWIPDSGDENS